MSARPACRRRLWSALAWLALLAPTAGHAQAYDFTAAFPDKGANTDPSPVASKAFSVRGPGVLVVRTYYWPHLAVNNTYNSGGVFHRGKSSDSPFPRHMGFKRYQRGVEVTDSGEGGTARAVVGVDMIVVDVAELHNAEYKNCFEVHPSVKWSLGGQMEYQNRWVVRITMDVYPPGTDINQFFAQPPKPVPPPEVKAELTGKPIVGYPKIKEFKGDYGYSATEDGVALTRNTDGAKAAVKAGPSSRPVSERFKGALAKDPGLAKQLGEALTDEVPIFDGALTVQVFRGGTLIHEKASNLIWISRHGPRPDQPVAQPHAIEGTSWIVNATQVPWVFHRGGAVEAPGQWKGTWTATVDGIQVTLVHQGVKDSFLVKLSADGKTFTAYKGGQVFRTGVRQK